MKPDTHCLATASLLDAGVTLADAGNAAALAAAIGAWHTRSLVCGLSLLLWPAMCWYASRTAIDAALFRALAADPDAVGRELDQYLHKAPGRTLEARIRGAHRLLRRTVILAAAQMGAVIAAALTGR